MIKMFVIGVDVGVSGAICALEVNSLSTTFYDLPVKQYVSATGRKYKRIDDEKLWQLIKDLASPNVAFFVVETQSGFGPIPGATKFGLGDCFGLLRGLILGTNLNLELVKSQVWKKYFKLHRTEGMTVSQFKNLSRLKAIELFPATGESLKRKAAHNAAEALLICEWGRRHLLHKYTRGYQYEVTHRHDY